MSRNDAKLVGGQRLANTRTGCAEFRIAVDLFRAQRQGAEAIRRRQLERLHALVRSARQHSAFYRSRYRGLPLSDVRLDQLPPVTKPELMAEFDRWVTDHRITRAGLDRLLADPARIGEVYLGRYFVCTTSGTTGHPGVFVSDESAVAVYRALALRLDAAWLFPGQCLAVARKGMRWAAVVGTGAHFAGVGWMERERRSSHWRRRAYRVFSVQQPLATLTPALDAFDPAILSGYPSALVELAHEQEQGRLHLRPSLVELTGESTTPAQRAVIADAFGGIVRAAYASSEFQVMAIECAQGWLHVMADWVILEPVRADGTLSEPGTPSDTVLLTNLANRVQPIIRYQLGDQIAVSPETCTCGSPFPVIDVVGRTDDVLDFATPQGRSVRILPLAIATVAEETPGVLTCQLVQRGPSKLAVRFSATDPDEKAAVWDALRARLSSYLAERGAAGVSIEKDYAAPELHPRSGKFRQVYADFRPSDRGGAEP